MPNMHKMYKTESGFWCIEDRDGKILAHVSEEWLAEVLFQSISMPHTTSPTWYELNRYGLAMALGIATLIGFAIGVLS